MDHAQTIPPLEQRAFEVGDRVVSVDAYSHCVVIFQAQPARRKRIRWLLVETVARMDHRNHNYDWRRGGHRISMTYACEVAQRLGLPVYFLARDGAYGHTEHSLMLQTLKALP